MKNPLRTLKLLIISLTTIFAMNSCGIADEIDYWTNLLNMLSETDYTYDKYPGMGASKENLQGAAWTLPNGISIIGSINGSTAGSGELMERGSGRLVCITITLKNENSSSATVTFPQGLTTQSSTNDYQNGILIKASKVTIDAGATVNIRLNMYCLNANSHASDNQAVYGIGPVTNIAAFKNLFEVCNKKRVNIEEYATPNDSGYTSLVTPLQTLVWCITHGQTFSKSDIEKYMKNIDNI